MSQENGPRFAPELFAPERVPSDDNQEADRRGYDVGIDIDTSPEIVAAMMSLFKEIIFKTEGETGLLASTHPNNGKIVILNSPESVPTAQLIGHSPNYQKKHGANPETLILSAEAQQRFDRIVNELTDLSIKHLQDNPPKERTGNFVYDSFFSLDEFQNRFSPAWALDAFSENNENQKTFMERRREYLIRLLDAVEKKAAERGTPLGFNAVTSNTISVYPLPSVQIEAQAKKTKLLAKIANWIRGLK